MYPLPAERGDIGKMRNGFPHPLGVTLTQKYPTKGEMGDWLLGLVACKPAATPTTPPPATVAPTVPPTKAPKAQRFIFARGGDAVQRLGDGLRDALDPRLTR